MRRLDNVGWIWCACVFFPPVSRLIFFALLKEHIDVAETRKRGVRVGYTPDVLTDAGSCYYYD